MSQPQLVPYNVVGRKSTGITANRLPIETLQKEKPEQFALFIVSFLLIQGRDLGSVDEPSLSALFKITGHKATVLPSESTEGDGTIPRPDPLPPWGGSPPQAASFLQIAGIHGLPYQEWSGDNRTGQGAKSDYDPHDKKDTNPVPSRFGGYCNHGSVLFPTWHRPYMLLIEQAIGEFADAVSKAWDDVEQEKPGKWTTAAKELRFPYWDWAELKVASEGLPPVLWTEKVYVAGPNGRTLDVENPLAYYPFGDKVPDGFADVREDPDSQVIAYFAQWKRTYRHADSSPEAKEKHEELMEQLKTNASEVFRPTVSHLFSTSTDGDSAHVWDHFSNHTNQSAEPRKDYNLSSLEGVHDSVHNVIGGNGHMADPDYAGFDPIFFLHHCNVDRLFALWEWCYPDYWMEDGFKKNGQNYLSPWTQGQGTYTEVYNEQVLPESDLAPFRKGDGSYWTSNDTRFLNGEAYRKYYSYHDVALGIDVSQPGTAEEREAARAKIQAYYGLEPYKTTSRLQATQPAIFHEALSATQAGYTIVPTYRLFVIVARLPEHAFNRSYILRLHLRGLGMDGETTFLGAIAVFARPDHSPCAACAGRRATGSHVRGAVAVPPELVDQLLCAKKLDTKDTDDQTIMAAIREALVGKIVDAGGNEQAVSFDVDESYAEDAAVPDEVAPASISLLSALAAHPVDRKEGPYSLTGWQKHCDIFQNGWKKSAGFSTR